eukprot:TRINITY_DN1215_c0_g1_i1.p1 TRINITY_DN1215_c0_g1~~TRINITY_DN1215_c0_g1_i1.p1  ORF type:complete len:458 (-),score=81.93 TRINITY_DN1215_c0_g1_i1:148-1521(-)
MPKGHNEDQANEQTPLISSDNSDENQTRATVKAIGTSGVGLLADGYDLFVVNLVLALMGNLYPQSMQAAGKGLAVSMTLLGVIIGQLSFGFVADIIGRKKASLLTTGLTMLGAILSSLVVDAPGWGSIAYQLAAARFVLGIGIGGEYPLSAAIASEAQFGKVCPLLSSRRNLLIVNQSMMYVGGVLQAVVVVSLVAAQVHLDLVWRLALVAGAFPSSIVFCLRLSMEEPEGEERGISNFSEHFQQDLKERKRILMGACGTWFLFNISNYGFVSFSHILCEHIFNAKHQDDVTTIYQDAAFSGMMALTQLSLILALLFLTGWSCNRKGLMIGFAGSGIAIAAAAAALPYSNVPLELLVQLAIWISLCYLAIGTYLVPAEEFPASIRGTCCGVAAASGKCGAFTGTLFFPNAVAAYGLQSVLVVNVVVMFAGLALSYTCTPPSVKDETLEDNSLNCKVI